MLLVLTNDDGIDAPGLQALVQAVELLQMDAVIVAPQDHLSGCGHQVTTTKPIQVQQRSDRAYAIAGTPADCVRLAVSHLCPEVTCVLSGINAGGNLGADIYISGTVAAAREAALHRRTAIAISHYRQGKRDINWELAAHLTAGVVAELLEKPTQLGAFWNVNLPHLLPEDPKPQVVFCDACTQPLPAVYRLEKDGFYYAGKYSDRLRDGGKDVDLCFSGQITVTDIHL